MSLFTLSSEGTRDVDRRGLRRAAMASRRLAAAHRGDCNLTEFVSSLG
jgi:hypothetical protein